MILLCRPRRPARSNDWTNAKAVTFIVTLAATRSVTLAARAAGMSRKAAYALRDRDARFADAWRQAFAIQTIRRQGNKVEEVEDPPFSRGQGNNGTLPIRRDRGGDDRLHAAHFERLMRSPRLDPVLLQRMKPLSR